MEEKKKGKSWIAILILSILLVISLGLLGYTNKDMFKKDDTNKQTEKKENKPSENEPTKNATCYGFDGTYLSKEFDVNNQSYTVGLDIIDADYENGERAHKYPVLGIYIYSSDGETIHIKTKALHLGDYYLDNYKIINLKSTDSDRAFFFVALDGYAYIVNSDGNIIKEINTDDMNLAFNEEGFNTFGYKIVDNKLYLYDEIADDYIHNNLSCDAESNVYRIDDIKNNKLVTTNVGKVKGYFSNCPV